jgi:ParB/RepB/Spo0J family partition protein
MSSAVEKTQKLKRLDVPVEQLEPNPDNPNEMSDAEFNMLYDNIERTGITDPILVRQLGLEKYRIVGGHHRYEIAKLLGMTSVPCTVIDDPDFDDDQERFQMVRMNVIRGQMSPQKFLKLYESLSKKYADDVMSDAFGFAEAEEFRKLVAQVTKNLPKELQKDFKKAAEEIKTIDGLAKLLNGMFTKYGDTLPYGFMCFDFGGKDSVWLRCTNETRKALLAVGKRCVDESRTVDDLVGGLLRLAANGSLEMVVSKLIEESHPVLVPQGVDMPTANNLNLS